MSDVQKGARGATEEGVMRERRNCSCPRVKHQHGTEAAYSRDDCRCLPCALARHRYVRAWKAGAPTERSTVPIRGTRLRLQALCAIGYSPPELAARLGTSTAIVQRLRSGYLSSGRYADSAHVLLRTHLAVAALYDVLWDTPSTGKHARRLRNLAARNGWLPPLALDDDLLDSPTVEEMDHITYESHPNIGKNQIAEFIDEIAVEQAIAGRPVRLTRAEVTDAVRRLTAMGFSAAQIAERVGVTDRTVTRRRAA